MSSLPEKVAHVALAKFSSLPDKCKPRTLADGTTEWTPMSAVILADENTGALSCVSLATGTKCLSASALPKCKGLVLHDSHAEILALRGFNYWLLSEVRTILESPDYHSAYLDFCLEDHGLDTGPIPPFKIKNDISIHFFTTEAPCGDASMEILMRSLASGDTSPWQVDTSTTMALQGRGHFSLLGYVRRKPARADADPSASKSCSDKLAVKQFTSVLSFPTDLFIQKSPNAYLQSVVVYANQYSSTGYDRAFGPSGRLHALPDLGHFFKVEPLPADFLSFAFEKRARAKISNISTLWIAENAVTTTDVIEILINGVKQGFKQWDEREKKSSIISRRALWRLALLVSDALPSTISTEEAVLLPVHYDPDWLREIRATLSMATYDGAKLSPLRSTHRNCRTQVTQVLGNWTRNIGDGDWRHD